MSAFTARLEGEVTQTVLFTLTLPINRTHFSEYHALPFWSHANGVYLKSTTDRPEVVKTSIATAIDEHSVPDSTFELPDLPRITLQEFFARRGGQ